MSDFKVTPEVDLTTAQMLERYQIHEELTLQRWAKLHGIDNSRGYYHPREVDLIDHAHHHVHNLGMSIAEYQGLLDRNLKRSQATPKPTPAQEVGKRLSSQVADEAYQAIELLTQQYAEAIDIMGERIAEHFIDELDLSVMRHLANKVRQRRNLNGDSPKPNRFLQAIKAVLTPNGDTLLVPKKNDEASFELEHNHRLG